MNELQTAAVVEGYNQIMAAFQSKQNLDISTLKHWINSCLLGGTTPEKKVQLVERDVNGDIFRTSILEAGRAEMCGYRLLGAFKAVESLRASLEKMGVTFDVKTTS